MKDKEGSTARAWKMLEDLRTGINNVVDSAIEGARGEKVFSAPVHPPVDIVEKGDQYVVTAETPGVSREEIVVNLEGSALTIAGTKPCANVGDGTTCHRAERVCGSFERTVTLPGPVRTDLVRASYFEGILTVELTKAGKNEGTRIVVQPGSYARHVDSAGGTESSD